MRQLNDRVAIVTGAASGIGAASAVALAAQGAKVGVADIDETGAHRVATAIQQAGGIAEAIVLDVKDEAAWVAAVSRVIATWGSLHILHNNAAAVGVETLRGDTAIVTGQVEIWDRVYEVNLRGVMLGCKHSIPPMIEQGGGVIINTSSISAMWGGATSVAYAASKSGIVSVTQHVASRYGAQGIRCVALAPGLIISDNSPASDQFVHMVRRHQCLSQAGRSEDIANAVAFLASEDASFITGVLIPVDGGLTCHRPWLAEELEGELGLGASTQIRS
jgi:NAD(P)-dependent dehydrogenase (short-subunit alcohol dehydrogenase family)